LTSRSVFLAGFTVAAVLRLGYLATFPENWDTQLWQGWARTLAAGGSVYRDTPLNNYSPVWAWTVSGISRIADALGIPFHRAVGVLLFGVDVATAWMLFRIARDVLGRSPERAAGAALLFFSNPISVFVTGFHAQFDGLTILCLLAAVWLEGRRPSHRVAASGALAASLLIKHVTAFHPLLFGRRQGRRGLTFVGVVVPYAIFLASFLPYWRERSWIVERVVRYSSMAEDYGVAMLRRLPGIPGWLPTALFIGAAFGGVIAFRRLEPARACLLLFLVILIFLPGISEYYFVWPIALGSLYAGAGYAVFTLLVSAFFLGSPDGLGLPIPHLPGWHGVWWGAVLWLLWELRQASRSRANAEAWP